MLLKKTIPLKSKYLLTVTAWSNKVVCPGFYLIAGYLSNNQVRKELCAQAHQEVRCIFSFYFLQ